MHSDQGEHMNYYMLMILNIVQSMEESMEELIEKLKKLKQGMETKGTSDKYEEIKNNVK